MTHITETYYNDKHELHRLDGPALVYSDGEKHWFLNGKRHKIDGPAIEYTNGHKEYYLNGFKYSFNEWDRLSKLQVLL